MQIEELADAIVDTRIEMDQITKGKRQPKKKVPVTVNTKETRGQKLIAAVAATTSSTSSAVAVSALTMSTAATVVVPDSTTKNGGRYKRDMTYSRAEYY